jgi:hypothetical protein
MLLVQLGINSTRDVWKFAKLDSPRRLGKISKHHSYYISIPNCTRHRMITNIGAFCLRMRENRYYEKYGLNFCSISQNSC